MPIGHSPYFPAGLQQVGSVRGRDRGSRMDMEALVEPIDESRYRRWGIVAVWASVFAFCAAVWAGIGYLISSLLP